MEMLQERSRWSRATNRSLRSRASSCEPLPVVAVAASYKLRATTAPGGRGGYELRTAPGGRGGFELRAAPGGRGR